MTVPKDAIRAALRESGDAVGRKRKQGRRKRMWCERGHSSSAWHADYQHLDDGSWPISYENDASRFMAGWGVFNGAAVGYAIEVLDRTMSRYGKPRSMLANRGF